MKIGVGIVTYERFDRFKKCFESVMKNSQGVDYIIIVDDCSVNERQRYDDYFKTINFDKVRIFVSEENNGVGHAKNKILKTCYNLDCDYIFTIEDDMIIKNHEVWDRYITVSKKTNIQYLNFALHGPANKKGSIVTTDLVALYPHCVGAFSLHTKKLIDEIGYYDENYLNAWEHIDYYYLAAKNKLTTPFWNFADVSDSADYIVEQDGAIQDSQIRKRKDWQKNIIEGQEYFKEKNGIDIYEIQS